MGLAIHSLKDKKDMADICAAWSYAEWGSQCADADLDKSRARYRNTADAKTNDLPLTWVAVVNDKPSGMISLKASDHPDITDLTPWLGSLYVHPWFRGQGIARQLMAHLETQARVFGFERLYLFTGTARNLYEKAGWRVLRPVRDPARPEFTGDVLMTKELN